MRLLSTIKPQPLRWLWPYHVPLGKLSLIVAEQGKGKSFLALDLAARVSAGAPWPNDSSQPQEPAGVLLLVADDLPDIVCPRLEAAGANLNQISAPEFAQPTDEANNNDDDQENTPPPFDFAALEQEIKSMPNCRLVVIDPLSEFLPPMKNNRKKRPDWPLIFKSLAAIAARTGVAIIATMSFIPSTSAAANHRAVATIAANPGPACVWRIAPDAQQENLRYLLPIKNNLAPPNVPLEFELTSTPDQPTAKIAWKEDNSEVNSPLRVPVSTPVASSAAPASPRPDPSQLRTPNSELPTSTSPVSPRREPTAHELAQQRAAEKPSRTPPPGSPAV